jgi:hypothetical protein
VPNLEPLVVNSQKRFTETTDVDTFGSSLRWSLWEELELDVREEFSGFCAN